MDSYIKDIQWAPLETLNPKPLEKLVLSRFY